MEAITYDAPEHWAPYLINGDASGMEPEDIAQADALQERAGGPCVGCEPLGFRWRHDGNKLGADCERYTFLVEAKPMPAGYTIHRSVLGNYRWRFEVNGAQPDGQASHWDKAEARQAAWDHWTRTGNATSRACPQPIGMERKP